MSNDNVVGFIQPGAFEDRLTEILRGGARALLTQAVEAEVAEFLASHADLKTGTGRQRLVRHGHLPEREVMTGIGPVAFLRTHRKAPRRYLLIWNWEQKLSNCFRVHFKRGCQPLRHSSTVGLRTRLSPLLGIGKDLGGTVGPGACEPCANTALVNAMQAARVAVDLATRASMPDKRRRLLRVPKASRSSR